MKNDTQNEQKIGSTMGELMGPLGFDKFGYSVVNVGDLVGTTLLTLLLGRDDVVVVGD